MHQILSKRRAHSFSMALFFVGLAILSFTGEWWPGILLAVGIPMALRKTLLGKGYDAFLILVIFGGVYVSYTITIRNDLILPILFLVAALFIVVREFASGYIHDEAEDEEDLNHEIEEDLDK